MIKDVNFTYKLDGKEIPVYVTVKSFQRGTYFRYKNDSFYISCNYLTTKSMIISGLDKFAKKLVKSDEKRNIKAYSIDEKWVYLFGEKLFNLPLIDEKTLQKYLKKELLTYLMDKVRYFEALMRIDKPYSIHVKNMKTRFGSNSYQTHSLSFQLDLVHFSKEIIDSVIVHELAHEFYRNHQKKFYEFVYKFCPNYWELKKKLIRREFK